ADDDESPAGEIHFLSDGALAAEELFLQLESEDADRSRAEVIALADEAALRRLAPLDGDERGRDAIHVDAPGDSARGDNRACLPDRADHADQLVRAAITRVFHPQATPHTCLGPLHTVAGFARLHEQHP